MNMNEQEKKEYNYTTLRKMHNIIDECESELSKIHCFRDFKMLTNDTIKDISKYLEDLELITYNTISQYGNRHMIGLYDSFMRLIHNGDILVSDKYDGELEVQWTPSEGVKFYDKEHDSLWYLNQIDIFEVNEILQLKEMTIKHV